MSVNDSGNPAVGRFATAEADAKKGVQLVDVAGARHLTQHGFRVLLVLAVAIGIALGVGWVVMAAISIATLGDLVAVIALACALVGLAAVAMVRHVRAYRRAYDGIVGNTPPELSAAVERALPRLRSADAMDVVMKLSKRLAEQGARALALRIAPPAELSPVSPFDVPFEPQPLNEQQSALVAAAAAPAATAATQPANAIVTAPAAGISAPSGSQIAALRRRLRLSGQGIAAVYLAFQLVRALIDSISRQRPTELLFVWAGLLALFLFVPIWQYEGSQWYVVPGAIICRTPARSGWNLRLFRPRESVLCVAQLSPGRWCAVVAGEADRQRQIMTPIEARFLLAAWLSPLPPPTEAQLSDLT